MCVAQLLQNGRVASDHRARRDVLKQALLLQFFKEAVRARRKVWVVLSSKGKVVGLEARGFFDKSCCSPRATMAALGTCQVVLPS